VEAVATDPVDRDTIRAEVDRIEVAVHRDLTGLVAAAERVRDVAAVHGWTHEVARARLVLADISARADRLEDGAQAERDILVEALLADDALLAARAHHLLGGSLDRLGLMTEALAHAADAVHLLPADAPAHLRVEHTMLLALMSSQQLSGNGFRSSFDQVIADAELLPTPDLLLAALNSYAWLLHERGEAADAAAAVDRMRQVAERTGIRLNSAALDTAARVLLDAGDLERAEEMARAAIAPDAASSSRFNSGEGMLTLAEIRWARGDADGAYLLAAGAEELAVDHNLPEIRALALRQKARLLAERGDYRGAYEAATAYHDLWATVRSRETDSRAVLLQTVLHTDEARRRSALYEELAERDPLTGVWNRRHLNRILPAMLGEHDASGIPLSVAIVDLDRFKAVNDERDHEVGDAALCRIADLLDVELTEPAFAVRLGGDEFLLVLPDVDERAAAELGDRARRRVAAEDWNELTRGLPVTISVGVATSTTASTQAELMRVADDNMYRAKRAGGNTVQGSGQGAAPVGGSPLDGPVRNRERSPRGRGDRRRTHHEGDDPDRSRPDPDPLDPSAPADGRSGSSAPVQAAAHRPPAERRWAERVAGSALEAALRRRPDPSPRRPLDHPRPEVRPHRAGPPPGAEVG